MKLKGWINKVLKRGPAGRSVSILDDDTFIVSYPKSGNTWLRFLIANLVFRDNVDFARIESLVPDIYQHSNRKLLTVASPRYLKSHEPYDPGYRKVVYVARDPRDIAVSYYYYHIKVQLIPDNADLSTFVNDFLANRLDQYGSWGDHIGSWLKARDGDPEFLLLRYEDLLANTVESTRQLSQFLNLDRTDGEIQSAITASSFKRMRAQETAQSHSWRPIRHSRKDMYFVRKARSGGWREELSEELAQRIVDTWPWQMSRLGYTDQ